MNHYEIINEYNGKIKYDFLPKIIDKCLEMEHVENAIFSIIFIDDEKMHELNKTYRGIDRTTDVLSFAYEDNETIECDYRMLGEIFVSIPKMKGQAIEYGHSETRELSFLVVHGILHLLGYDHTLGEKEEKEMFSRQELVLNEFEETRKSIRKMSFQRFLNSIKFSIDGLVNAYQNEQSLWLHAICTIGIIILGFLLQISFIQWAIIVIALVIVLAVELLNTAIEATVDLVTKEIHPLAKVAKDCGSAAAFVSSIMVFIICCFIFVPKIIALFKEVSYEKWICKYNRKT